MTCREFVEFLWRYLNDELPPAERRRFEEHMAGCTHCTTYLRQYLDTIRMGKTAIAASSEELPSEVPEDLVQAILRSRN